MKQFNYARIVRDSRTWFNDACRTWMWDGPRQELESYLERPEPQNCFKAIGRLEKLAVWHAREGCVAVADGRTAEGWRGLMRFYDYRLFTLETELEINRLAGGAGRSDANPTLTPFHLLGMAMAFKDYERTRWLGERIVEGRESKVFGHRWGSERRDPFRCFICELFCQSVARTGFPDDFGPYAAVFGRWQGSTDLSEAVHSICDYHVQQIKADGEFENNPHDIFPSEILALYRVREKLGLETPWVNHPLLDTPFTQVPEKITYEPDPLVVQAMDLVTKLLPEALAKR